MTAITVKQLDSTTYEVSVQARTPTQHMVTVADDYAQRFSAGKVTTEWLIERSFEFLLERESNTSILRHFELSVIARYFPEYERVIKTMLD